jgi:hypothetical protein
MSNVVSLGIASLHGVFLMFTDILSNLAKMGLQVMTFEGNMADEREFDEARTARMIDLFVTETLGLKKVA